MKDYNHPIRTGEVTEQERPETSKAGRAAREIRARIVSGQLRPGQRLNEIDLVRDFGVSRTPIRHALATLQSEGLVTIAPNRGAIVINLSLEDLEEIYTVVAGLEALAAALAAPFVSGADVEEMERLTRLLETPEYLDSPNRYLSLDVEFHRTYLSRCPNQRLKRLIRDQLALVHRYRRLSHSIRERLVTSLDQHRDIAAAFREGDAAAVRRHVEHHIREGGRVLKEYLAQYGLM